MIKFFEHHLRRLPWLIAHIPLPSKYAALREKQKIKRLSKLDRDFTSYKIAYERLREESGLLYLHLNKTKHLNLYVTIVDKLGIAHYLDLNDLEFIVQYKADLAFTRLKSLICDQRLEQGKEAIDSMLSLVICRYQRGIYDEDPRLHCNLGFMGEKAMLIDIGRLRLDPNRIEQKVYSEDIKRMTHKLKEWLFKENSENGNLFKANSMRYKAVGLLLALWGIARFCHHQTEGFRLSKIKGNISPFSTQLPSPLRAEEKSYLDQLLDQPYTYLAPQTKLCVCLSRRNNRSKIFQQSQSTKSEMASFKKSKAKTRSYFQKLPDRNRCFKK